MFNHHRGLWGYTGTAADGAPLTIQATGMGGPSAAIVLEELARLGVRAAVRVGTARGAGRRRSRSATWSRRPTVLGDDGDQPRARRAGAPTLDRSALARRARRAGAARAARRRHDLFYAPARGARRAWRAAASLAADLETAALAAVAPRATALAFGATLPRGPSTARAWTTRRCGPRGRGGAAAAGAAALACG